MKKIILTLICVSFLISTGKSQESKYSFKENYKFSSPTELTVSSYNGAINIFPSDNNEIELRYIITKNNKILSNNKDDIKNEGISLQVKQDENSLDIGIKYPVDYFKLDFSDRTYVNFEIYVPKETYCNLISHDGNISIQGLTSDQHCTTSDGNIKVFDVIGNTTIKASDGKINLFKIKGSVSVNASDAIIHAEEIEGSVYIVASDESMFLKNINGQVQCKAIEGNIELINVNGEIKAETSEGHILFTNLSGSLSAHSLDGDIKGNIQELKKPVTIETGGGNIDISFTNKIGLDFNCRGIRTNTQIKNFKGSSNKYFMKGKVNGGGIAVNLLSIDGKIKITY